MRKILLLAAVCILSAETVYAASVPDDDSAQYYPYPAPPQQSGQDTQTPAPKPAPSKKAAPKKKAPAKKAPAKKSSSSSRRRPVQARLTSLQKGIQLMQQERYEQAKPYLLKAIQEERNNPNAWYWYGVYHEKTGGFYQAQYFYSKAVTIDPAFEPLSRVVFYPEDSEKTPLWDPKHPARVYPVETASVPMNVSKFPNAPDDPEVPEVPIYIPPEPGSSPLDGDSWNPVVYVPPSPEELTELEGQSPTYIPPDAGGVIADERQGNERQETTVIAEYQVTARPYISTYDDKPGPYDIITERDKIMRAEKPRYTPPEPGQKVSQPASSTRTQNRQSVSIKTSPRQPNKQETVPASRVVRQKKTAAPAQKSSVKQARKAQPSDTRKTESQDAAPKPQARTNRQTQRRQTQTQSQQSQNQQSQTQQSQTSTRRQQTPVPVPERQPQPEPQPQKTQNEYMPPVGQYTPDPGTIPDKPMPPVGQGNQN